MSILQYIHKINKFLNPYKDYKKIIMKRYGNKLQNIFYMKHTHIQLEGYEKNIYLYKESCK